MDIFIGDPFGGFDFGAGYPNFGESRVDLPSLASLEAAIGNISVGTIEGGGEAAAMTEPIPDPLEDAARYERRRVTLGRSQSLLTGGLGALGTPPVVRTSLLGRRL